MITQSRLKELLRYDPKTGAFTRLVPGKAKVGSIKKDGRVKIRADWKMYSAHRLAWLYMTGSWPPEQIDHIDGNPSNNRFSNLRLASNSENHCNKLMPNNTSGFKGVRLDKRRNRWRAEIKKNGKVKWLGYFKTIEDAARAYAEAAPVYHGDFARVA